MKFIFIKVDVWSVGCIFAELLGKRPLFQGKNCDYTYYFFLKKNLSISNIKLDLDQVSKITDILGTPPPEEMQSIQSEMVRKNFIYLF